MKYKELKATSELLDYSIECEELADLLSELTDIGKQEDVIRIDIYQNTDGYGYSACVLSRPIKASH